MTLDAAIRADTVDVIVIGGGPVGENVADYAVAGGLSAVIVESELLGGECSYWACMPSKALLRTGHAVGGRRGGCPAPPRDFDPPPCSPAATYFTHNWDDDGQVEWAEGAGIAVLRGHGRLAGERTVVVDDAPTARRRSPLAVPWWCAPGASRSGRRCRAWTPSARWSSRDATSAKEIPARLGVLGGGVVGCELAQAFQRLGSQVTLLQRGPRLLPATEPFAGERVAAALRERGGRRAAGRSGWTRSSPAGDAITLHVGDETITVDELLVATGRRPNTADVGVETVGLEPGEPLDGGRLRAGRGRRRAVALRRGRRHRPGAAHPPGQVPGADRRRGDRGPRRRGGARHRAVG